MTDEKQQQDELEAEKAFDSGFTDQPATETKEPTAQAAEPEEKVAEPPVETPAEPEPEFVQIKRNEFDELMAAAKKTASLEQQMSKAFGTIGYLKQMVEAQPKGGPAIGNVEIGDEVLAELREDFPEMAEHMKKALQRVVSKVGTAPGAPSLSKDDIAKMVMEDVSNREMAVLETDYPDWRDVVGSAADTNNEFRAWLKTKAPAYQEKVNTTQSALVVSRALDYFTAYKEKQAAKKATTPEPKPPQQNDRRRVIAGAVLPKGDGGPTAPRRSDQDAFDEGFRQR